MNKLALIGLVLVGLIGLSGVALAQTAPVVTCGSAMQVVAGAQVNLDVAKAADKAVADAEAAHKTLADARVEEAAAVAADNATVPPLTEDSQRTKDAKAAVIKAEKEVKKHEALDVLRPVAAKTDALKLADTLKLAIAVRDEACRTVVTPPAATTTVTTPPPATTTTTVKPKAPTSIPSNNQFDFIPDTSGGVDTGGA